MTWSINLADAATAGDSDKLQELIDRQGVLLEDFERLGGYSVEAEVAKVLDGLGFDSSDPTGPASHAQVLNNTDLK